VKKVFTSLLDCIYPTTCFHCETLLEGAFPMCAKCYADSMRIIDGYCKICGEDFDGEFSENPICPNCHSLEFSFAYAKSALKNTAKNRQLIISYKYGKQVHLVRALASFCNETLQEDRFTALPAPILVPVPLHWRRKFNRGFNQAELLCKELNKLTGIPWRGLIRRHRYTTTQTRLSRGERLHNLEGAFSVRRNLGNLKDFSSVIIVDDVFTTGSTSEECAKILKKEFPKVENIVVLTVLRG